MAITFDEELQALKEQIFQMGGKVEESIRLSIQSLVERDSRVSRQVIQGDRDINDLEIEIDETCHRLLVLYQPVAVDMRFITSCVKINSDLERMGDLAVNISERALTLNQTEPLKPYVDIPHLAVIVQGMLRSSLESLLKRDPALAKKVREQDSAVDDLNDQLIRVLISYMLDDRSSIKRALDLILVSRYLERIADHAVNICNDVIYLVEGKDVRHSQA